jgi:hypothetical protein
MAKRRTTGAAEVRRTAIHEAGHAVASYFLHVRMKHVTIVPERDSLGHVRHRRVQFGRHGIFDDSLRGTDRAERHIIVCFAGQIAQRKYAPHSQWRIGGSMDQEQAMELFWHIASADEKARNLQLQLLWRRTELLIELHWKDVRSVAAALLKRKTLDATQVAETILRAYGLEPFTLGEPRADAATSRG